MAESFRIEIDATKFKRTLKSTPDAFRSGLSNAAFRAGEQFRRVMKFQQLRGSPGVNARTGNLARNLFNTLVEIENGRAIVMGFAGVPYANIQEHGGTIRPKKSKWLTIPVGPALTASGVARGPARSFEGLTLLIPKGLGRSPMLGKWKTTGDFLSGDQVSARLSTRNVYQGVSFNFRTGKAKASLFVPYFILKKSVYVPPRLRFIPTFQTFFATNGPGQKIIEERVAAIVARINNGGAQSSGSNPASATPVTGGTGGGVGQ